MQKWANDSASHYVYYLQIDHINHEKFRHYGGYLMLTSDISNLIAVCAFLASIFSIIYTCKTNTKKYELSEDLRKELLNWYDRCINVLVLLRKELEHNNYNEQKVLELNSELYSLTELGRFYFPNYNRKKGKGVNNSEAYKGNRALLIDLLVESHNITKLNKNDLLNNQEYYLAELKIYQKGFTTEMFLLLDPDSYIQKQISTAKINYLHRTTFSESEYAPNRTKT